LHQYVQPDTELGKAHAMVVDPDGTPLQRDSQGNFLKPDGSLIQKDSNNKLVTNAYLSFLLLH
jgi:hypothetical protein